MSGLVPVLVSDRLALGMTSPHSPYIQDCNTLRDVCFKNAVLQFLGTTLVGTHACCIMIIQTTYSGTSKQGTLWGLIVLSLVERLSLSRR